MTGVLRSERPGIATEPGRLTESPSAVRTADERRSDLQMLFQGLQCLDYVHSHNDIHVAVEGC